MSSSASSGMNSMNRTMRPVSRAKPARSMISSSLTPAITTTLTFTGASPACSAASIASSTVASTPRRRIAAKRVRLQRVAADVDAHETGRGECRCQAGEAVPVRGHGQIRETDPAEPGDKVGDAGPHERLAAGEAQRVDPEIVRDRGNPLDLLEGEDLGPWYPGDALFGHAVDAAQVAAVGHRDPQVGVDSAEGVDERTGRRHRERR